MSDAEEIGGALPVGREFELGEVRAIRFEGLAAELKPEAMIRFADVTRLEGPTPLALNSVDGKALVGMVKLAITYADSRGIAIGAQGLLDYSCQERLLLETGQLALQLDVRIAPLDLKDEKLVLPVFSGYAYPTALYVVDVRLQHVPANHPRALVPAVMSWLF